MESAVRADSRTIPGFRAKIGGFRALLDGIRAQSLKNRALFAEFAQNDLNFAHHRPIQPAISQNYKH